VAATMLTIRKSARLKMNRMKKQQMARKTQTTLMKEKRKEKRKQRETPIS
jgi:hypothetical protein